MALDTRFDKRLIERNITKGIITREEYEAHIDGLVDAGAMAEVIDIGEPGADRDDLPDETVATRKGKARKKK